MLNAVRKLLGRESVPPTNPLHFSRPLVLLQSDDWGRVGVRDREGYELLRSSGIHLGENPYDYYSLETAEDVIALRDLLKRHRDSTGRPACMVMNFLLANLDFQKIADTGFKDIHLKSLSQGLPGDWKRPGLFEAYRQGISDDVFYPGASRPDPFLPAGRGAGIDRCRATAIICCTLCGKRRRPTFIGECPGSVTNTAIRKSRRRVFWMPRRRTSLIAEAAREFEKFFRDGSVVCVRSRISREQ